MKRIRLLDCSEASHQKFSLGHGETSLEKIPAPIPRNYIWQWGGSRPRVASTDSHPKPKNETRTRPDGFPETWELGWTGNRDEHGVVAEPSELGRAANQQDRRRRAIACGAVVVVDWWWRRGSASTRPRLKGQNHRGGDGEPGLQG